MMKHLFFRRVLAMALSAAMVLGGTPVTAMGATVIDMGGVITGFDKLPSSMANQEVEVGADLSDVTLPDVLTATVRLEIPIQDRDSEESEVEENIGEDIEEEAPDAATSSSAIQICKTQGDSDGMEIIETTVSIPVIWEAEPEFDGQTPGIYDFTPELPPEYTLAEDAEIPAITVTVKGSAVSGRIMGTMMTLASGTDWSLDDDGLLTISSNVGMSGWSAYKSSNMEYAAQVKSAVIEDGVIKIGGSAFYNCTNMTQITISDSVATIGQQAFRGCKSLESVTLPSSLTTIDVQIFQECSALTSVIIPKSVKLIGNYAFGGCTALKQIIIPDSVENINAVAFDGCTALEQITIPDSVKNINVYAFSGCTGLTEVTFESPLPPMVETDIFDNCSNLNAIYVPAGSAGAYKAVPNLAPYKDLIFELKEEVINAANTGSVTYNGALTDLTAVSGLFTVDSNAGARTYTVESGGTGAGIISGSSLTVTRAGIIRIGLETSETDTHHAGAKVIATLTVNKGTQSAPAGLGKADASTNEGSSGKITGLAPNTNYEYKKNGGSYTEAASNASGEITGLSAGTYAVRFAANDLYNASPDSMEIIIGQAAQQSGAKDVAGVTSPDSATINGRTITATVANSVTSQTVNLTVSAGAAWKLYSDSGCRNEISNKTMALNTGANTAYVKVTAQDGTAQVYTLTITRQSSSVGSSQDNGSGESDSSGSSSSTSSFKPAAPVTGATENIAAVDSNGNASTTLTDKNITDAVAAAAVNAAKQGKNAGEITVSVNISMGGMEANTVTVNLPRTIQQQIITNKIAAVELTIDRPDIVLGLNNAAITEISKQANADVQLTATKTDSAALGTAAKNAIGSRPAFDFKASYQDGMGSVTNFGQGTVYVSIPYTPSQNEEIGCLYAVYVDDKGNVSRVPGSAYDANSQSIIFATNHFSVYGVSYTDPTGWLTDVSSHWAKDSIDYVVGRGLLTETSKNTFFPDAAITRGMLVTALGRLSGIEEKDYKTNSFTDVKADSAYRPYIEWAYSKGIIQGMHNSKFAPDRAVTREETAAILAGYVKATGYTLPAIRDAVVYADASAIGTSYRLAVADMQQEGIMMGGKDNKFNPKSSTTRAEFSSMLYRYIKLTINPATAQGWALNDAGQYLYYKDGKVLTGFWPLGTNENSKTYYFAEDGIMAAGKWLRIDGKWYYFNADGSLARSTWVDGYEVDENGVMKII